MSRKLKESQVTERGNGLPDVGDVQTGGPGAGNWSLVMVREISEREARRITGSRLDDEESLEAHTFPW
jgi:hypothetical protein